MADDFCKFFDRMVAKYTFKSAVKRSYHRNSIMSKAEIMLIMILFHDSNYRCLKHFYQERVCKHLRHLLMLILLLIIPPCIPAFVKSLSYSMTNYILYENEQMGTKAIDLSMKMMNGHKMELFLLHLSFIGWGILSILTLGIGYIWLVPYKNASLAEFYEYVKTKYDQNNTNNDEYQRLER
jgi:uncharacterized membrane protein